MEIKGEKTTLIPMKLKEREDFYSLATKSYGSRFWYDGETKRERPKKEFFKKWNYCYLNSRKANSGKCFWIWANKKRIGLITYNGIDTKNKKVELDIIIGDKENMGKGFGTDALKTLIKYLFMKFNLNKIWIEARANNLRAVKAYQRAGFKREGLLRKEDYFEGKFVDCIRFGILKKEFLR